MTDGAAARQQRHQHNVAPSAVYYSYKYLMLQIYDVCNFAFIGQEERGWLGVSVIKSSKCWHPLSHKLLS